MKAIIAIAAAALLAGCGTKSVVQQWRGSEQPLPAHAGDVCLLPGAIPRDQEGAFLGRAVANQQWYGNHTRVNRALADAARRAGADVVVGLKSEYKMGAIAWARPQSYGMAYKLRDPAAFDCAAAGGKIDAGAPMAAAAAAPMQHAPAQPLAQYDDCMARVVRISDASLRIESMKACDAAAH